jgi:hypothetical protein
VLRHERVVLGLECGLFNELDLPNPVIGLYRRDLQRTVRLLVGRMSGEEQRTSRVTNELESVFDLDWNPSRSIYSTQLIGTCPHPLRRQAKTSAANRMHRANFVPHCGLA